MTDNLTTDPNKDNQLAATDVDGTDPNEDNQLPPNFKDVAALKHSYNEARKKIEQQAHAIKALTGAENVSSGEEEDEEAAQARELLKSYGFLTKEDLAAQQAYESSMKEVMALPYASQYASIIEQLSKANPHKNPIDIYAEHIAPLVKGLGDSEKVSAAKANIIHGKSNTIAAGNDNDVDPANMSVAEYAKWHNAQLTNSKKGRLVKRVS